MLDDAIIFATRAHAGQVRKGTGLPYILHPLETVAICAQITDDEEVLTAAVLHDVVEDTAVTINEIDERFGRRVASLVDGESEDKRKNQLASETWKVRKVEAIEKLRRASDPGARVVCLGDKLSNIRSINHDLRATGESLWSRFHQHDPLEHLWYYETIARLLQEELGETDAWKEYRGLVYETFDRYLRADSDKGSQPLHHVHWWGLFLDSDLPSSMTIPIRNQHVTFGYEKQPSPVAPFGACFDIVAIGYGRNEQNEGYQVEIPERLSPIYQGAAVRHITVGLASGAEALDTAAIDFEKITPFSMKSRLGWVDDDGNVRFESPFESAEQCF